MYCLRLLLMQIQIISRGRPSDAKTFDAILAQAFGTAVTALRLRQQLAQEELANLAEIERSHMGKIETGQHTPTLFAIFKISSVLKCNPSGLLTLTEFSLSSNTRESSDVA